MMQRVQQVGLIGIEVARVVMGDMLSPQRGANPADVYGRLAAGESSAFTSAFQNSRD